MAMDCAKALFGFVPSKGVAPESLWKYVLILHLVRNSVLVFSRPFTHIAPNQFVYAYG